MATTAAPWTWYNKAPYYIDLNVIATHDIRCILCANTYTPVATHEFKNISVTGELPTANGYTANGIALVDSVTATANGYKYSSTNPDWLASGTGLIAKTFVVYDNTPATNKPLLGYGFLNYNGGAPVDINVAAGFHLVLSIPTSGWFYIDRVGG